MNTKSLWTLQEGFLPSSHSLPARVDGFKAAEDLLASRVTDNGEFVKQVERLSLPPLWGLKENEQERHFLVLSMLMQKYLFYRSSYIYEVSSARILRMIREQDEKLPSIHEIHELDAPQFENEPGFVPNSISKPLLQLALDLDRPPFLCYASLINCNCVVEKEPIKKLTDIQVLFSFTDEEDEKNFYRVHYWIEKIATKVPNLAIQIRDALKSKDASLLSHLLKELHGILTDINSIQKEMDNNVDPEYFFNTLRPFFSCPSSGLIFQGFEGFFEKKVKKI